MKRLQQLAIALVLIGWTGAGCASTGTSNPSAPTAVAQKAPAAGISVQGYVTPVRHADLAFCVSGRIAEVFVKEGDLVKAGQPLVQLQNAELKAALAQAQAELARLQAGARAEEIAEAQAQLEVASAMVQAAQVEFSQAKNGTQQSASIATAQAQVAQAQAQIKAVRDAYDALTTASEISKEHGRSGAELSRRADQLSVQLAAAQAAYTAGQKQLTQAQTSGSHDTRLAQARLTTTLGQRAAAQAQLDLLAAGSTAEEIKAAQARVVQAQAALDETTLLAPFDGTVAEVTVNVGEMVGPGPRIASLADLTQWQVETDDLSELDVVNVQPGTEVAITVNALPGMSFSGQVKSVLPRSIIKHGDVTYMVKVAMTNLEPRLKWGMTALVSIP